MAKITSTEDPNLELTLHKVSGPVTAEELSSAAAGFVRNAPTRLALWDFTGAEFSTMPSIDLASVFDAASPFVNNRRGGRSALLFDSKVGYGLGRMSEVLAESRAYPYEVRSFWDREAALNWLSAEKETAAQDTGVA